MRRVSRRREIRFFLLLCVLFWPVIFVHGPELPFLLLLWWIVAYVQWRIWRPYLRRLGTITIRPVKQKRSRHIPNDVMAAVMRRDGGRCRNCGSGTDIQFDHIYPYSRGGTSTVNNIQLLCGSCNRAKSNKVLGGRNDRVPV